MNIGMAAPSLELNLTITKTPPPKNNVQNFFLLKPDLISCFVQFSPTVQKPKDITSHMTAAQISGCNKEMFVNLD